MPNTKQFIRDFGRFSFEEHAFSDADALALCQVFYMPLEWVSPDKPGKEPVNFTDAWRSLFSLKGNKHRPLGLMITSLPSKRLMAMAEQKRYSEMKIGAVRAVYNVSPAIQFCAGLFILPDGTNVIVFRGTDDTIAGWKEDLDLCLQKGSPSYELATDFLDEVADTYDGKIIICGHSKGGNIALRTAVVAREDIRKRISHVYNFDGPGYADYSLFTTDAYRELLPGYGHFIPSSSFIGVLAVHDNDFKAVKSSRLLGPFQHDLGSWQIKHGELELVPDNDYLSKITDEWLGRVLMGVTAKGAAALETIATAVTLGTGTKTLTDLVRHSDTSISGAVKAFREIDSETKDEAKSNFSGIGKYLVDSAKFVLRGADKVTDTVATAIADAIS